MTLVIINKIVNHDVEMFYSPSFSKILSGDWDQMYIQLMCSGKGVPQCNGGGGEGWPFIRYLLQNPKSKQIKYESSGPIPP